MGNVSEAHQAIKLLNNKILDGQRISVEYAKPYKPNISVSPTPTTPSDRVSVSPPPPTHSDPETLPFAVGQSVYLYASTEHLTQDDTIRLASNTHLVVEQPYEVWTYCHTLDANPQRGYVPTSYLKPSV